MAVSPKPQGPRRSETINFDDRLGKGLRPFLREVVSDAPRDRSVRVFAQELVCVYAWIRVRCAVGVAFECNRWNRNRETLAQRLNALLDERPRRRAARLAERERVARKVAQLVRAIEPGSGGVSLLAALADREAELRELDLNLSELDEPLEQRLAVIPGWVRQQVSDVADLLSESPERAKREFRRLRVAFTVSPVVDQSPRPFLRAVGTTDFSAILAGSGHRLFYYRPIPPAISTVKSVAATRSGSTAGGRDEPGARPLERHSPASYHS